MKTTLCAKKKQHQQKPTRQPNKNKAEREELRARHDHRKKFKLQKCDPAVMLCTMSITLKKKEEKQQQQEIIKELR